MNSRFVLFNLVYLDGLLLFLNGFLLTRRVLLQHSNATLPSAIPNDFDRVLLVVIDALRYDFIQPSNASTNSSYLNQMPFVRELLERRPKQSVLRRLMADPPATTLQRLKALTTGTLPTFIDLSYNFVGYEIEEDNLLHQLQTGVERRNVSLLGDDTWVALYPRVPFQHLHVYPTVDNSILQHLWTVLEKTRHDRSSLIIGHFLGVDHCGHRHGPFHPEMKRKLNQMDEVIRNLTIVFDSWNSSSLLIVIGDHGGDEFNELATAMFLHTNKLDYFSESNLPGVSQIDLVPTLSWFLRSLIPFSSLGMMMIDVIPVEQRYAVLCDEIEFRTNGIVSGRDLLHAAVIRSIARLTSHATHSLGLDRAREKCHGNRRHLQRIQRRVTDTFPSAMVNIQCFAYSSRSADHVHDVSRGSIARFHHVDPCCDLSVHGHLVLQ